MLAYAVKQKEIDYNEKNLVLLQAQLINKNDDGHVMVEKVSKNANSYAAGKYYIPDTATITQAEYIHSFDGKQIH